MNGNIDDRNPSYLLKEIKKNLNITLTGDESIELIENVLRPFLQNQFNEGVEYAKTEIQYSLGKLGKQ